MTFNITNRDIKTFVLGIISTLAFVFILDWTTNINDVEEGSKVGKAAYERSKN